MSRPGSSRAWGAVGQRSAGFAIGRRLTAKELDEVIQCHGRFLTAKPGGSRALLANTNLADLDIRRRILIDADFSGADLSGAKLAQSVLDRATLYSANLSSCDARFASFKGADLRGASLKGGNFSGANLESADLRSAAMLRLARGGHYRRVIAEHEAGSSGVDFSDCNLNGANFGGANLVDTSFRNAILTNVEFGRAVFSGVCLDGAIINSSDPSNLPFTADELKNCLLDPGKKALERQDELREKLRAHERWAASDGKSGEMMSLEDADLRVISSSMSGRQLTAIKLARSIAVGVDFTDCQLQGSDFELADLRSANFKNADLRGAIFKGANLMHANFDGAKIGPLVLVSGVAQATDLTGAKVAKWQLEQASRD